MGMSRWVSEISHIQRKTTFGLSHFAVGRLDFSYFGPLFQHFYYVSCRKRVHPANRGGERRGFGNQVCNPVDAAFPLSCYHDPSSHCCFGCCDVQVSHPLPNAIAQNCKNLWQKTLPFRSLRSDFVSLHRYNRSRAIWGLRTGFGTHHRNYVPRAIRCLRPTFETLHRNYAASGASADLKLTTEMLILEPDESNGESGEDDCDKIRVETQENILRKYHHSGQPVDFQEVERIHKVVEELFTSDRNVEATLDQCGVSLSHSLVYHALRRFSNARKPAFRFFQWAGQQVGFSHNSLTYNMMVGILGSKKQFVTMCELLEEMGKRGSVLTIETFEIAIKAFAAGREMKKAVQTFTLMERYNFGATVDDFNTILDALGRARLVKEAQMLFETMRERFPPDAKTYTVLLSGWCKVKNLTHLCKLWNEMVDAGFKPDLTPHNIMLEGLFWGRRKREALKFFDLMKTNGPSPNARSYTIVICALCKLQKMEEAMRFFVEMQENGCPPDVFVYTYLMTGYGTAKELGRAYELLQEMKDKGIPHDCRTYNALIKVMVNLRKPDEATKLFDEMMQCGFEPSIHTYNMLMKLYFSTKKSENGFAIWNRMVQNGCNPDVNSYTVFIGGLIREGRSQEACTYIESMIEEGMKAPHFDYHKFLSDFSRAGRPDIFEELAQKMKYAGKLDIANMFIKFSQKTKKRFKRRLAPVGPVL